jgi:hypothetical protein
MRLQHNPPLQRTRGAIHGESTYFESLQTINNPLRNTSINLTRNSRVRFWTLLIARAGYAIRWRPGKLPVETVRAQNDHKE